MRRVSLTPTEMEVTLEALLYLSAFTEGKLEKRFGWNKAHISALSMAALKVGVESKGYHEEDKE